MRKRWLLFGQLFGTLVLILVCPTQLHAGSHPPLSSIPLATSVFQSPDRAWSIYTNGNNVNALAVEGATIWAGTTGGVMVWNRDDHSHAKYTTMDGLPGLNVQAIAIDSIGSKWIHTSGGIGRFDGETWETVSSQDGLVGDAVRSMVADRAGRVWFGTDAGVSVFEEGGWTTYSEADGLPSNQIIDLAAGGDGHIWAFTEQGIGEFDGGHWTLFPIGIEHLSYSLLDMAADGKGNVWFSAYVEFGWAGVIKFDGNDWITYTTDDGLACDYMDSIAVDSADNVWFAGCGISKFDGSTWTDLSRAEELAESFVNTVEVDIKGQIYVGTTHGIGHFDGYQWTTYITENGLLHDGVRAVALDANGHIWIGYDCGWASRPGVCEGVTEYDGSHWIHYRQDSGWNYDNAYSLAIDAGGDKWFGTMSGIQRLGSQGWNTYSPSAGSPAYGIEDMAFDQEGQVWVDSQTGVYRFDGNSWIEYPLLDRCAPTAGRNTEAHKSIIVDSSGDVWIGRTEGVHRISGDGCTTFTPDDGLAGVVVTSLTEDSDGRIWIATTRGLSMYDGDSWTSFHTEDGLANDDVRSITLDPDGNLWCSFYDTSVGLSVYDGALWKPFVAPDELLPGMGALIGADPAGHLWFRIAGGLAEYRPEDAYPDVTISGRVADPLDEPMPEVAVWAGFPTNSVTDEDGLYELTDLEPGTYDLHLNLDGNTFFPLSQTVTLPPDATGVDFKGMPGIDFRPEPDGYGFKNYIDVSLEDYTMSDMQLMFGDEAVCYMDSGDCVAYKPTAMEWNIYANKKMEGGHCDGMATTSLRLFQGFDYSPTGGSVHELDINDPLVVTHWSGDIFNTTVRRNIAYFFVEQLTNPIGASGNTVKKGKPSEILAQLVESFSQEPLDPVKMFVHQKISLSETKGHTITPYAIEEKGDGIYWIWVYDNRYPGEDSHHVIINKQEETWEYDMGEKYGVWKGDAGTYTLGAVPISLYSARQECPWCNDVSFLQVHYSSESQEAGGGLLITNTAGQRLGMGEDAFLSEIPGAYEFVINDLLEIAGYPFYVLPVGETYTIQIKGDPQAETVSGSVTQFGPGYAAEVKGISLSPGAQDTMTIASDGSRLTYQSGEDKEIQLALALDGETKGYQFTLDGVDLESGQTFSLQFDRDSEELNVSNDSIADDNGYDIEFVQVSAQGEQRADYHDVEMAKAEMHAYDVGQLGGSEDAPMTVKESNDQSTGEAQGESMDAPRGTTVLFVIGAIFILGMILSAAGLYLYFRKS